MRRVQREQSELQPPPVPPHPLFRPDVFTSKSIFMNKPRGCSLGVDLDSDSTEGAEVDSVEAFGLAWRNGLKPGAGLSARGEHLDFEAALGGLTISKVPIRGS